MFLLIVYISVALGFSFLCSIAEAVLLSVTPAFIATLEKKGSPTGHMLRQLKDEVDRPLAAILSLNTIAHTIGAAGAGAQAAVVFGSGSVGIASAILTLLILVFSEIIPKTLGAVYWRQLAGWVARTVKVLIWVLYPFVLMSEKITKILSKGEKPHDFSREEFMALANLGQEAGHLNAREFRVVKNLLRFHRLRVKDIMTPRTVVFSLQEDMLIGDVLKSHPHLDFSRIPLFGENRDDKTGFILKTDILLAQARGELDVPLRRLKRDLHAVPDTVSLFQIFDRFVAQRDHILLVVDEYGGAAGIVTLEDVVETLLGLEIVDEGDPAVDMRALAREQWEARAHRLGILPPDGPESD